MRSTQRPAHSVCVAVQTGAASTVTSPMSATVASLPLPTTERPSQLASANSAAKATERSAGALEVHEGLVMDYDYHEGPAPKQRGGRRAHRTGGASGTRPTFRRARRPGA